MKKILLSAILILCIAMSSTVFATDSELQATALNQVFNEYELTASVPVTDLYVKDEVYVEFGFKEDVSVYGIEAVINYDSKYLEFKDVECSFSNKKSVEIVNTDNDDEITYICSRIGKEEIISENELLKLTFVAKKTGKSVVEFKSLKVVYENLSYEIFDDTDLKTEVSIIEKEEKKPSKKGSSSRGGGGITGFSASREDKSKVDEKPVADEKPPVEEDAVEPEKNETAFSDISSVPWAGEAIEKLTEIGAINGYEDGTFRPDDYITRAELTKIIAEVFLKDEATESEITFKDVSLDAWYYNPVKACASFDIINGENAEAFAPDRNILREEFATMLARCAVTKKITFENQRLNINFIDENEISDYAVGYVDMLYTGNVLNGDSGYFYPKNNLTRAEAAVGIYNLLTLSQRGGQE